MDPTSPLMSTKTGAILEFLCLLEQKLKEDGHVVIKEHFLFRIQRLIVVKSPSGLVANTTLKLPEQKICDQYCTFVEYVDMKHMEHVEHYGLCSCGPCSYRTVCSYETI